MDVVIPEIETDRLLLRSPKAGDAAIWARFLDSDPDFLKYVPTRPGAPSQERAERFVGRYTGRWEESPLDMGWSVTLKAGDELIGFAGVEAISETDGEIDYYFARPYWRRGYASEAAKAITDYWFRATKGLRIVAFVIPENVGSVRAITKLGYSHTGRSVNYLDLMGNPPGVTLAAPIADEYILAREEWALDA